MTKITNTSGLAIYKRLLTYVLPLWKVFVLALLGMVATAYTEVRFAELIDPMLEGGFVDKDKDVITMVSLTLLGIFTLRTVGTFVSEFGMAWVSRTVVFNLRGEMFEKFLVLPVEYYDNTTAGRLQSKMIYDVEQLAEASSGVIKVLVQDSITIIWLLGVMLTLSVSLTMILLATIPFVAIIVTIVTKKFRRYSQRIQASMGTVSDVSEESVDANREIKIFGGQQYELNKFKDVNTHNRKQFLKFAATNAFSAPVIQQIVASAFAVIVYVAANDDITNSLKVGQFASFLLSMILLMQHAKRLTTVNSALQRGIAAAQSVFSFLDIDIEKDKGRDEIKDIRGSVQLKNVSFKYKKDSEIILKNINLDIKAGQSVAFVGRSGAGKTTLVSLLPRFYNPTTGNILIDGNDTQQLSLKNLRKHIALVSQHVTLFNDTIAHNIAYGGLEIATEESIIAAAKAAHAYEFIEKLPNKLNTIVGDNGLLLSGGQRQRLAIARAFLKDAPILILDEATSALDTESERYIQDAMAELLKNRTTFIIAHRLSTIENVDLIVVMDHGEIIEQGSHNELIKKNGVYTELHKLQFSRK